MLRKGWAMTKASFVLVGLRDILIRLAHMNLVGRLRRYPWSLSRIESVQIGLALSNMLCRLQYLQSNQPRLERI